MQWQFGDWASLIKLDAGLVESHPRRAMLALLAGAAHLQVNDLPSARQCIRQAREWGCDSRAVARILIAGVHNTLGRMAAVRHKESRALEHFRLAVDGVGGDARLAHEARSIREIAQLGLADQVADLIRLQGPGGRSVAADGAGEATEWRHGSLPGRRAVAPPEAPVRSSSPGRGAIVIAGMRHSGSTALFNVIRIALESAGIPLVSFYSEGTGNERLYDPDCPLLLIKTHEFRDDVAARATVVVTTRRDLRDTVASAKRRQFPMLDRLKGPIEYAKYNRALHEVWRPKSHYEFVYERYVAQPVQEIGRLLRILGLGDIDAAAVQARVAALPVDDYDTSLLSPTHITDPNRVMSYRDSLTEGEVERIGLEHADWLHRYGYAPE